MTNVVVIGAGYAGVLTAKKLEKRLRKKGALEETKITLIDQHPYHTMLTELHEAAACRVGEESVKLDLKQIFAGRKVSLVLDTVTKIVFEEQKILGEQGEYPYDYLVLAAGSRPTFYGVEGAGEHSFTLWSYEDAVHLRDHIHNCFRMAAEEPSEEKRRELLRFYVVGAGFTGVEMAGELAEYAPELCKRFQVKPEEVSIVDVDGLSRTVPILPEKLSAKVERRLKKLGVEVLLNVSVVGVGEDSITMEDRGEKIRHRTRTVIWTAGIESANVTAEAAKELKSAGRGRIQVDEYLRSLDHENVYIAGDNMFYTLPGEEQPVPQMVENAEHSASTVARNLAAVLLKEGEPEKYRPKFHGVMVCVGGRYGVARGGLARHPVNLASFFAMFAKHFVNVIYFAKVMGWTKVFGYLKHEFFTIRNRRSFLGGHFSNRTPSFLLVPLRVWLGAVWIFESVRKIVEGWFQKPMLAGFFGGANAWYDSLLGRADKAAAAVSQSMAKAADAVTSATAQAAGAVSQAADAVTSATAQAGGAVDSVAGATGAGAADAVSSAGTVLMNWNFGLFRTIFVSGKDLASSALGDYAFKVEVPLVNWFVDTVVLSGDGMQMFLQVLIVVVELLIGLGLIAGLFTFPSAAVSLILQGMFLTTTGLYLNSVWMIFASVAVLIGGGYTFGLDYYVGPFLKKRWKNTKWVKRWYLYND